jgi:hypothetical protein
VAAFLFVGKIFRYLFCPLIKKADIAPTKNYIMKLSNGKFYEVHDYDQESGSLTLFVYNRTDLYENGIHLVLPYFGEWLSNQDNVDQPANYSSSLDGLTQAFITITPEEDYKENEHYYIYEYLKRLL